MEMRVEISQVIEEGGAEISKLAAVLSGQGFLACRGRISHIVKMHYFFISFEIFFSTPGHISDKLSTCVYRNDDQGRVY